MKPSGNRQRSAAIAPAAMAARSALLRSQAAVLGSRLVVEVEYSSVRTWVAVEDRGSVTRIEGDGIVVRGTLIWGEPHPPQNGALSSTDEPQRWQVCST